MVVHDQVCRRDGTNGRTYDVTGLIGRSRICKKNILEEVGNNNSTAKGMNLKTFYKTNKTQFLKGSTHERKKQRHIYIKQRWKPEPREKRKNGWILETRRDGKTFWRIEEFLCCKYINLNNPFFITFNKYHQIQSHNIRWNPLEICIYNFTSTFTISSVFPSRQISNILPFYRFFRSRGFGFRHR